MQSISKKLRYRSPKLRYRYIPISKISRYRQMHLRYLDTISKLCASILMFVSFNIGVSLSDTAWAAVTVASTRYWTQISVCTMYCQCCQFCALAAHGQHWQQHRPQPPERRPDQQSTSAGPSCWSERSGARTSRVRQAEPGSRVNATVAATFDIEGRQGSRRGVLCTTPMV
jgi:hypothetical protein